MRDYGGRCGVQLTLPHRIMRFGAGIALLLVVLCWPGGAAAAVASRTRIGSPAPVPAGTKIVGRTAPSTELHLAIVLKAQNGLAAYATAVSTPGSPLYGKFLSVGQFAQRFGPTLAQVAAVTSALRMDGLNVGAVSANRLLIPVTATAAQAAQAFSVSLTQVRLPTGRTAYTNDQAPALPSSIAPYVEGVLGLSDVVRYQPAQLRRFSADRRLPSARSRRFGPRVATGGPQPCASALAGQPDGLLTADEVAYAYQFSHLYGAGARGSGQTIAMLELEPYDPLDVGVYQLCYGTHVPISNVDVNGGPGPLVPPPDGPGDTEAALDIEQAIGLAPNARILVYQGPLDSLSSNVAVLNAIVSQNRAKVISNSWGTCESLVGATAIGADNQLLAEAAIQGQSFFTASGDSGSAACYRVNPNDTSLSVLDLAGQPFATGVGGTTLYSQYDGCPVSPVHCYWTPGAPLFQSVWNDGFNAADNYMPSGTGGGISRFFAMPTYQSHSSLFLGVVNQYSSGAPCGVFGYCREVPDVAADADPVTGYFIYANGAWQGIGGTSASAPLWASFMALTNSLPSCYGHSVGFANPSLYALGSTHYSTYFNDVTLPSPITGQANNDARGVNAGLFPVSIAYDMTTGLGSMLAPSLASTLCALRAPPPIVVTGPPTNVGRTTATIHGTINPRGVTTLFRFDVGRTRRYGASSSPLSVGAGNRNVAVSATVTHLSPNTTYHYRVVAIRNGRVVAVGGDRTFKTKKKKKKRR